MHRRILMRFAKLSTAVFAVISLFALSNGSAQASTVYYWFGGDTTLGGTGTWDATSTNYAWSTSTTSPTTTAVAWTSGTDSDAYFQGDSNGTLSTAVQAGNVIVGVVSGDNAKLYITNGGSLSASSVVIGRDQNATGMIQLDAGGTITSTSLTIATNRNSGTLTQNGGRIVLTASMDIGVQYSTIGGLFILNDGTTTVGTNLVVGRYGKGAVTQNGGSLSVTGGILMATKNGSGKYLLEDGMLTAGYIEVGENGSGVFTMDGGTCSIGSTGTLYVGRYSTAAGTMSFNGGLFKMGSGGILTGSTNSNLVQLNGGTISSLAAWSTPASSSYFSMTLGTSASSVQYIDTTGGNATINAALSGLGNLTKIGTGILYLKGANTYTGTTTVLAGTLTVGDGTTNGEISSSSAIDNNGTLVFNRSDNVMQANVISGSGSMVQTGAGTLTITGNNTYTGATTVIKGILALNSGTVTGSGITVGNLSGNNGTIIVNGGFLGSTGGITVGAASGSTGYLNITNGGYVNLYGASGIYIGNSGAAGTLTMDSGTISGRWFNVGNGGTGTFNMNGGVANSTTGTGMQFFGTGTFNMTGGELNLGGSGITANSASTINLCGGTLGTYLSSSSNYNIGGLTSITLGTASDNVMSFNPASGKSITINASMTGLGALTKIGAGTLTLTAANSYSGATTVNAGTLYVSGTGSLASTSILVSANSTSLGATYSQTLTSAGTVFSTINSDLGTTGSVTAAASSTVAMQWRERTDTESAKSSNGLLSDVLALSSLTGVSTVSLTYDSLAYNASTGYTVALEYSTDSGTTWTRLATDLSTSGVATANFSGVSSTSSVLVAVVPEPGTFALLGGALVGLIAYAWRRRK